MKKICTACGEEKLLTEYHNRSCSEDGKNHRCKVCINEYNKRRTKEGSYSDRGLRLSNIGKKDWCQMYSFLKQIGYDPSQDIHNQFASKYNLEYKKRHYKNHLTYTWDDCLETTQETNTSPDQDLY